MFNRNWNVHVTSKYRYESTGIFDLSINHLQNERITNPIIIDVGCSYGQAIKWTSFLMKKQKFNPWTIGIDGAKTVKKQAEKNLDEFIAKDVFEVVDRDGSVDIVICHKAAIFVVGSRREAIIRKCTSFLKANGILITDVDCFQSRTMGDSVLRFLKHLKYQVPTPSCFKHGIKNFGREYDKRVNTRIRIDVFKLSKQEAVLYADNIIHGWENRSHAWKWWWKFRISTLMFIFTF